MRGLTSRSKNNASDGVHLSLYMKLLYSRPTNFGMGVAESLKQQQRLSNPEVAIRFSLYSFAVKIKGIGQGYHPEGLIMQQYYLKIVDTLNLFLATELIDSDLYNSSSSMFRIMGERSQGLQHVLGILLSDLVMLQGDIVIGEWDYDKLFIPEL